MKKVIVLILVLFLCPLILVFFGGRLGIAFLERDEPQLTLEKSRDKSQPGSLSVVAADNFSGLSGVLVTVTQGGQTTTILDKKYELLIKEDKQELSLIKFPDIKEGKAQIKATVTDNSLWKNQAVREIELLVDYSAPRLALLSLQHVAAQGGAEFVIYKASDSNLTNHGVSVGEHFFRGYPVKDTGLESGSQDTYGSLFALPLGFDASKTPLKIIAEDEAGNVTNVGLGFRIEPKKQNEVDMKLSDEFLMRKNPELYPGYQKLAAQQNEAPGEKPENVPDEVWKFMLVNHNYRKLLDARLKQIALESSRPRLWKEVFMKPMPSATSSTFGEKRSYFYKDIAAGGSVHNGLDLASVQADAVFAANDGVVLLAEDFGIYGNAVMIDHGLGLFTLYGHLSSIDVKPEQTVKKGMEIGKTGQTGLAGGDHLHFEFRIRDVPVTPIEWWDSKWIKDNIDGKLAELEPNADR